MCSARTREHGEPRMRLRGICYNVGWLMGINWRPVFDPKAVRHELEVIKKDLRRNAVFSL